MATAGRPDNRPEFAVVDVHCTDPVKDGDVWQATAMTIIKHRTDRPPDPPKQVIFLIDGVVAGRPRATDSNGRAETDLTFSKAGRYYLEVQIVGTSFVRGRMVPIEEKKEPAKEVASIRTSEQKLADGRWIVCFVAKDLEGKPVKGAVITVLDGAMPGGRTKLAPTDENGLTYYTVELAADEKERRFDYHCGRAHNSKRIWR